MPALVKSIWQPNRTVRIVINLLMFELGWFVCVVLGGVYALAFTVFAAAVHHLLLVRDGREWLFIAGVVLAGAIVDSTLVSAGVLAFPGTNWGIPLWLVCVWLLFATTLSHSLSWLRYRLPLGALLAAVAGPLSYLAGTRLTEATLGEPWWQSVLILSLCWALLFPACLYIERFLSHDIVD